MITINLNIIPNYFKISLLYKKYALENISEITISSEFTKFDDKISNMEDLYHYLDTIKYWNFIEKDYPLEIFTILDDHKCREYLCSYSIRIKYADLSIIDEIGLLNKKRPSKQHKPKIINKKSLLYLEGNELIEEASENGYFGLVKYALKIGYILTDLVALKAAEKGHASILQYCFDNISILKYTENKMEKTKYNDTIFLKIVSNELQPKCYFNSICRHASRNGHLECLMSAHKFGCFWNENVCVDAASSGHYECLKYAHENGCNLTKDVCYYASSGHIKCLKYAHENGCSWDSKLYEHAIIGGDLESIKYAHQNGCTWNKKICEDAALLNFYDILKYAIDNNGPKSSKVCNNAASKGNIDCLKYAFENGCTFDKDTCYEANYGENIECMKYVHENGCLCTMDNNCVIYKLDKKFKK
jgi:hypothetical protein